MLSENFDKRVKEAAEHHHAAYDEQAWAKMQKLLDTHLPQKDERKRRIIFFILFLLLLGGAGFFIVKQTGRGNRQLAMDNKQSATGNKQKPIDNGQLAISNKQPTINNGQLTMDNRQSAIGNKQKPIDNGQLTMDNRQSATGNKQKPIDNGQLTIDNKQKPIDNGQLTIDNKQSATGNRQLAIANTQKPSVKDNAQPATDNKQSTIDNGQLTINNKQKPSVQDAQLATSNRQPATDTKQPAADNSQASKKTKPGINKSNSFFFTLSTGADMSAAGSNKMGQTKLLAGAGIGYTFKNRFTLRTGFYSARKIYTASPYQYHPPDPFWTYYPSLQQVNADCRVYEIPLYLSYNFSRSTKQTFFAGAGISSYLMKRETYNYLYKTPLGQLQEHEVTLIDKNRDYFSVLTLSGGYQRNISKTFSVSAEPYLKIPITGIGYGKVNLNSAGVLLSVAIRPFAGSKSKGTGH